MFGLDSILGAGLKIIDKFVPDPAAKIKAENELRKDILAMGQAQNEINKVEAASSSVFVSGWRPWIGWVCGIALAFQYVIVPLAVWVGALSGHPVPVPPKLDAVLWELMFGMLGMGGLRTFEKLKGVARN